MDSANSALHSYGSLDTSTPPSMVVNRPEPIECDHLVDILGGVIYMHPSIVRVNLVYRLELQALDPKNTFKRRDL
jgi:hypothetical protein